MASNRIKGITIELDANITPLQKALSNVDKSLKNTQSSLKDVNKLLKLDPSNVELLKQKQDLLKTSINDTKDRLKTLKQAYKELDGKNTDEARQQQALLAREISETEQNLKSLQEQYKDFGSVAKQVLQNAGDSIKEVGGKITDVGKGLTTKVTAPLVAGFALAMDSASDYEENINKLDVAFGEYADQVRAFTDNAQMDYGLSKKDASESAAAFGALAKGIGLADEQSADMAVTLTQLSSDLASYFNTDIETSASALEGIFTGNATSLKKFGVVMTDANLKEFAEELGMTAKQYANLGQEDKTLLRMQYVMSATADAQGDFARTSDGTANSIKSFQASIEDLTTLIGEQVIPIVTPIIQKITEVIRKISEMDNETAKTIVQVGMVVAALGPVLMILGTLVSTVGRLVSGVGALFSPMGAIVLAIGAVVAAGIALYQNWDTIKAKAQEVWGRLKEDFGQIKDFITEKIDALVQKFSELKDRITNAFSFDNIKSKISGVFSSIGGLFGSGGFAFGSGGYSSGGMMSNSISISNNFTVSGSVTESQLRSWANIITDQVNENLGRMV